MGVHGHPRATGDIDILVDGTPENSERVYAALADFGAPVDAIGPDTFAEHGVVFEIGIAPRRIDLLTEIDGVGSAEAYRDRVDLRLGELTAGCISRRHLVINKLASGRPQDLLDAETLQRTEENP